MYYSEWRQWICTSNVAWTECAFTDFVTFKGKCIRAKIIGDTYEATLYTLDDVTGIDGKFEDGFPGIDLIEYFLKKFDRKKYA